MVSFVVKGLSLLNVKNEGQFVFTIGSLFLALLTIAIFMSSSLTGANVIQNAANFSDSSKLLFALVPFFFFVGAFMMLISSNSNS